MDALAKEFGGAATVTTSSTGRLNTRKTIVTIYIPQYSPKLDARVNPPARKIATH